MNRKNELRKSGIQRWLLVIAGLGSIGGLALSEPLAQQATSPPQAALASTKVPETTPPRAMHQPQVPNQPQLVQSYGKLPLSFEPNQGQTDPQVKFLSRGRGYTLFLTPTEAVLALRGREPVNRYSLNVPSPRPTEGEGQGEGAILHMQLEGANPSPLASGLSPLPGIVNYFIGNDPKKWHTNIPTYQKVQYKEIYPGIDLVYYGSNQRQLEYDLVVAPGADPNQIKLAFQGSEDVKVDTNGNLVLKVAGGEVQLLRPHVYQEIKGKKQLIAARYILTATNNDERLTNNVSLAIQVGIQLASYDATKPVIIDPVLFFSTYLGGSVADEGHGIAVDAAGNAYVTGFTGSTDLTSTNFPTASPLQAASGGLTDVFVAKLNATGSALLYSTYLGGSGDDVGKGIAVDAAGNAYVTGRTGSTNFPTCPSSLSSCASTTGTPLQAANGGGAFDAFVAKLNASGTAIIYSTYLGGSDQDDGHSIAVDNSGSAYVTGTTRSPNFPTKNPLQAANGGGVDAFVAKINAAGLALVYSTYLGGATDDQGTGIAVDTGGNVYVSGLTTSPNFPTCPFAALLSPCASIGTPLQATNAGGEDAFVAKLSSTGASLLYSTYLGGTGFDAGTSIAVDGMGNAYVTGNTTSTNFPTQNPFQGSNAGNFDVFITKLNASGSALVYSTYLGGSSRDTDSAIAVDAAGNAYVTGATESTNFPTKNPLQASIGVSADAFVAKLNATGSALVFSTYLGGNDFDEGAGIAVDAAGNAYVTGFTISTDFPTANPLQAALAGDNDAFVAKICNDPVGTPDTWTATGSMGTARSFHTATLLPNGKVLVAGGQNGSPVLTSAELYDPAVGTFASTGALGTARNLHTATLLPNGKVLIAAGGDNTGGGLASAELYNPAAGTFAPTGSLGTTRLAHTATLLPNGNVLIAGGVSSTGILASAELYDPAAGTFAPTGSMGTVREHHSAALLPNGTVLIAGGMGPGNVTLASAELYNPATGTFAPTGAMGTARVLPTATLLPNGKVLIAGGGATDNSALASAELYDPAAGTFSSTGALGTARLGPTATLLPTGKVLITGGCITNDCVNSVATAAVELYDPAAGTFSSTGALGTARLGPTATLLPTGKVLVAGGQGTPGFVPAFASAELYKPALCLTTLTITTGNQTLNEGSLKQFTLSAFTPTSNAMTFTVQGLPPGATFNSSTGQISWRPAPNQAGTYGVTVTVTDGVSTVTKEITLSVADTILDSDLDGFPDVAFFDPLNPSTLLYPKDNCGPNQPNTNYPNGIYNKAAKWVDINRGVHPTSLLDQQPDFDLDGKGDLCDTAAGDSPLGPAFVGKVTNTAVVSSTPANGTTFTSTEPIFITATTTFQRVDYLLANGQPGQDGIPDPYFAVHPDAFNVFLQVFTCASTETSCNDTNGTPVQANRILEAPALFIPFDLLEIPGGTDPCPAGTVQVAGGACQASTLINVTESRTGFTAGTMTLTPTYFNFIRDPEVGTQTNTGPCTTVAQGCFTPIWMGLAQGPPLTIKTAAPGAALPTVTPTVTVNPATWDLRWDTIPSAGQVDVYLGNLPSGYTLSQIEKGKVLLNGSVAPASFEVLSSFTGFTGPVLHLRYREDRAMASLRALVPQNLVPGQSVQILLTGPLTSDGNPGPAVALLKATPTVTLALKTPTTLLNELIAKVQGLANVSSAAKNSLVVKLQDAKTFLSQANTAGACTKVQDFINLAMAQAGKKQLTVAQANDLGADATFIKAVLGCP